MEVANQVCILYAVTHGYLSDVSVDKIPEFEKQLYEFMNQKHSDILESIRATGKLEPETEEKLKDAISQLRKEFLVQI